MNLDRVIAVRNTKTIYRDGDHCVKVFNENYSKADILNEALNQARIEETGLHIPKILGVCHSMAHKLGAFHHIPHGIANALMIEEVLRFNAAETPAKMGTFPQYDHPHTLRRYAEVAEALGVKTGSDQDKQEGLIKMINNLTAYVDIKPTIRDYVPDEKDFLDRLDDMVEQAFDDQCTGANPRYPLMSEIRQMYLNAYYGEKHFTETPKPTADDIRDVQDDAVKKAYRPGRKL